MNRGRLAYVLITAACLVAILAVLRLALRQAPSSAKPPSPTVGQGASPGPAPVVLAAPLQSSQEGREALETLLRGLKQTNRGMGVADARKLRDLLLAYPPLLQELMALIKDPSASLSLRQAAAVVAGTLPTGKTALLEVLRTGIDSGMERTVILSIGIRAIDDGDMFDRKGEPFSMEPAPGLFVFVSGPLSDPESRSALARFLAESPTDDVRRAAARVLRDSTGFADVRTALFGRLETERDPETLGEGAAALAAWTRTVRLEDAERGQVVGRILDLAPQADEVVRFRLAAPISSTPLAASELERLRGLAADPAANTRQFAAEVLGKRIGISADEDSRTIPILSQAAVGDKDADVREAAALALGRAVRTAPSAVQSLTAALREDASWEVRAAAARSLGQAKNAEDVRAALQVAAKSDAHATVRQVAERSLSTLK